MWRIPIRHAPSTKLQHRITNRQCLQWWGGGKPVQISRAWRWGPDYVVYVLTSHDNIIIYLLYKLTFFGPSSGHSATESRSFRFSVKIFSLFALYGGPEFPPPGRGCPNPLSAALSIYEGNFRKNFSPCSSCLWHRVLCRSVPASRRSKRPPSSFTVAKTSDLRKMCHEFKR